MKHLVLLFLSLTLQWVTANAKDSVVVTSRVIDRTGPLSVRAEYGLALNNVSFTRLPGVQSCCTDFVGAQGVSASLSASLRLLTLSPTLTLQATAGGSLLTSPMSTTTQEIVDYRGDAYDATIRHDLAMRYWFAQASIDVTFAPTKWLNLSIGVGGALPVALDYSISETMKSPDQLVFETGTTTRNQQRGSSPSAQFALYMPITVTGPAVKAGRELVVRPVISAQQYLTSLNSSAQWGATVLRAGLTITRDYQDVVYDTVVHRKPDSMHVDSVVNVAEVIPQRVVVRAGVRDSSTGKFLTDVPFAYNVNRRRLAVLPSVFFDSAQAVIPDRFRVRRNLNDSTSPTVNTDLDVSHSMLHIVAATLQRQRSAMITLVGTHAEDGDPDRWMQLARGRAVAVREYLVSTYGIDSSRIRVKARAYPERPSSIRTAFGRAENRRVDVELSIATYDLPIQPDTLVMSYPASVEVTVEIDRLHSVQNLRLGLVADGKLIKTIDTLPSMSPLTTSIAITKDLSKQLFSARVIEVTANVLDSIDGLLQRRVLAFRVQALPDEDQPFDEFGIVLFDYNSSRIAESEDAVLRDLRQRVSRADRITITGTADQSGNEADNLRLAEERAQSVVRALGLKAGTYELQRRIATEYSNELPEGRMLSRQVKIVLQTGKK